MDAPVIFYRLVNEAGDAFMDGAKYDTPDAATDAATALIKAHSGPSCVHVFQLYDVVSVSTEITRAE